MSDVVFDTTVVDIGNQDIAHRRAGNSFDRTLNLLQAAIDGALRIRYNNKLRGEYEAHVRERRNDFIENFFTILDSPQALRVGNTLSRQHYNLAVRTERWPSHDQHLISAALGGNRPRIYVTEQQLLNCAAGIYRRFRIRVQGI
jgi:hypothetical protein